MKKQKKIPAMKLRDFLKASAVAGAAGDAVSLEEASGILERAEGKKAILIGFCWLPLFRYLILARRIGIFT